MTLPRRAVALLVLSSTWAAACSRDAPWPPALEPLDNPAAVDSAQPQLTVSSRGVLLSWVERSGPDATLRFAERETTGWSEARTVASGTDWFVNWADVPSVLRLEDGTLAAHWLRKNGPDTYAYDVRLAYSRDEGHTWSDSFTPHHDATATEHGFASLFQLPGAGLGLIWLDGRAMQSGADHGHGSHAGGSMGLRFTSFDREWRQGPEVAVDTQVCECCPTTAALTSDGIVAAFRNRSEQEIRDIYVARLESGRWTEGTPVHADGWEIPACPVNGPALSARDRDVALAWFTMHDDQGHAFVAFSGDAGRTFGAPIRLDDEAALGRVDVELLPDGSAVASWIEFAGERAHVRARRIVPAGERSEAITIAGIEGSRASGYPRLAYHDGELLFAWTDATPGSGARFRIRTARTSLTAR